MERHVHGSSEPARPRHLLMIARDFPPANSSAALRALALTRSLAAAGWRTSVITVPAARHAATDPALAERLQPSCAVRPAFGVDSKSALAIRGRYPRLLAFPDRDASWLLPALCQALRVRRAAPLAAVLSSSPPVTAHCVAGLVRRLTGVPWIAELRDPWNVAVPLGGLAGRADRWLERRVYGGADRVVVTTEGLADQLRGRGAHRWAGKIRVVANGYDERDFAEPVEPPAAGEPFTIVHAGVCLPPYRDPRGILAAVRACLDRGALPPETRVVLLGGGGALRAALRDWLAARRLTAQVEITERVPHRQAIAAMRRAPLLLLLQDLPAHDVCVPQKTYEYLRSGRPLLAVAPAASSTAAAVREHAGVFLASPADGAALAAQLAAAYAAWRSDPGRRFERAVASHERTALAARLLGMLEELHGAGAPEAAR